jgi:hypothetical protein
MSTFVPNTGSRGKPKESDIPGPLWAIESALNTVDALGGAARRGFAGRNPLGAANAIVDHDDEFSGRDMLRSWGVIGDQDTYANYAAGLGAEIATDPLTYAGGVGILKGLGKAAVKQFFKTVATDGIKAAATPAMKALKSAAKEELVNSPMSRTVQSIAGYPKNFYGRAKNAIAEAGNKRAEEVSNVATGAKKPGNSLLDMVNRKNESKLKELYNAGDKDAFEKEVQRQANQASKLALARSVIFSPGQAGVDVLGGSLATVGGAFKNSVGRGARGLKDIPQGVETVNRAWRGMTGLGDSQSDAKVKPEYTDEEIDAMSPDEILSALRNMGYSAK